LASVGHVRDLTAKNDAIDTENNFQMKWETSDRGKKVIKDIANAAQTQSQLSIKFCFVNSFKKKLYFSVKN
jgi:DNA topoisomerase IA